MTVYYLNAREIDVTASQVEREVCDVECPPSSTFIKMAKPTDLRRLRPNHVPDDDEGRRDETKTANELGITNGDIGGRSVARG